MFFSSVGKVVVAYINELETSIGPSVRVRVGVRVRYMNVAGNRIRPRSLSMVNGHTMEAPT